jgi:hypothetical protein
VSDNTTRTARASFVKDQVADTDREAGTVDHERQQRQFAIFAAARAAVLLKHPDLDLFMDAMDVLAAGLTMTHGEISPTDYLEALYVVVKTASFTAPLRERLLETAVPVSTLRM